MARVRKQREHRPHELGPRVFFRGRWAWLDLRPWGGERIVARDPSHPNWPKSGAKTDEESVAREWGWKYVAYLKDQHHRARRGLPAAPRVLQYAIEEYLEARANGAERVAANTVANDRTALNHLLAFVGSGEVRTDRILVAHDGMRRPGYFYLQDMADNLLRAGYAESTVQLIMLGKLKEFFGWLNAGLDFNELNLPKPVRKEARAFTDDELGAIREAADWIDRTATRRREFGWPSARLCVEFFVASGCRQQEGFVAEWQRIVVRPDYATIRIVGQYDMRGRSGIIPLKAKKDTNGRVAVLLDEFVEYYSPRKHGYILGCADGSVFGVMPQRHILITRRDRDKRSQTGPGILTVAGLEEPGVGWHTFRHTYARLFIERGGRFEELRNSLGHKSVNTTEQLYGHFHEDVAAKLAGERMARLRQHGVLPAQLA